MVEARLKNPRRIALDMCFQVVKKGQSLTQLQEKLLPQIHDERDRGFVNELSFGVCRFYFVLDQQIKTLLKKPLKAKDQDVQLVLMMGLYQIRFMRVENHAAVNESVKLLAGIRKHWAKGLVNAVLRAFIRSIQDSKNSGVDGSSLSELEHKQAYPVWMQKKIEQDWAELASQIYPAANRKAGMTLRVDTSSESVSDYLHHLKQQQISAHAHKWVQTAIVLDQVLAVDRIPGFEQGQVSVQDASAQLAAELLDCKPGMQVLDACAAPGGKTLHILQSAADLKVTALDQDQARLHRISENLDRAGLKANIQCADAVDTASWSDGQTFDRILLDAPCSASGIIRRHPDIRLLRRSEDIDRLVTLQSELLHSLWPLLKPGGLLVYSTCSIFKQENEQQVASFLDSISNGTEVPIKQVQWGIGRPVGRQILPGFHEMDGFYYAVLKKSG